MSRPKTWRYKDFIKHVKEGNDYYAPFELKYIEGYRRTDRNIFFDQKWQDLHENRPEKSTWHDNVLRLGHLIAHDSHTPKDQDTGMRESRRKRAEKIFKEVKLPQGNYGDRPSYDAERPISRKDERFGDKILTEEEKEKAWQYFLKREKRDQNTNLPASEFTPGSHFWARETYLSSGDYSGNIDLKVWLPTDGNTWLHKGDGNHQGKTVGSMGEFKAEIGKEGLIEDNGLREYRENKRDYENSNYDINSLIGRNFQLIYDGELSLKNIKEIRDHKLTDGWVKFSDYLKILRKKYIFDMEEIIDEIVIKDDINQQLNFLNSISDDLRKLQYYLNLINKQVEAMKNVKGVKYYGQIEDKSDLGENFRKIVQIIEGKDVKGEGYSAVRKRIISKMDEELNYRQNRYESPFNKGIDTEDLMYKEEKINHAGEFLSNVDQISEEIERILEECRDLGKEEKQRRGDESIEALKEEEFENKLDRRLTHDVLQIPNIRPIAEKIENKL